MANTSPIVQSKIVTPVMPTKAILLGAVLLQIAGCGRSGAPAGSVPVVTGPITAVPASQPSRVAQNTFYDFDDPRCSPAQRQAIRAATRAVVGTATPSSQALPFLHFQVGQDAQGWGVSVWYYGPGQPATPGGYTDVQLGKDFAVRGVMAGE